MKPVYVAKEIAYKIKSMLKNPRANMLDPYEPPNAKNGTCNPDEWAICLNGTYLIHIFEEEGMIAIRDWRKKRGWKVTAEVSLSDPRCFDKVVVEAEKLRRNP